DVTPDSDCLHCFQCKRLYHLHCLANITKDDFDYIVSTKANWKCPECERIKLPKGDNTPLTPILEKTVKLQESDSESSTGSTTKKVCNKCNRGFAHNAHRLTCKVCHVIFHLRCVDTKKEDYANVKQDWACSECVKVVRASSLISAGGGAVQTDSGLPADKSSASADKISLSDILSEMVAFRREVKTTNKEINDSLQKYSDWIEDNNKKIDEVTKKLDTVVSRMEHIQQENINLRGQRTQKIDFF
ncbi:hypothetical protein J6590_107797, partial [Homalodisca vitripennis]